jgi:hypothetical protein
MSENDDTLLAPLYEFHKRTQELLTLARAGDWPAFEEGLAERQAGVQALNDGQFLIAVAKAGRADELRQGIADIQTLNDEMVELAEQSKARISAELKETQLAEKGIQAYEARKAGR